MQYLQFCAIFLHYDLGDLRKGRVSFWLCLDGGFRKLSHQLPRFASNDGQYLSIWNIERKKMNKPGVAGFDFQWFVCFRPGVFDRDVQDSGIRRVSYL